MSMGRKKGLVDRWWSHYKCLAGLRVGGNRVDFMTLGMHVTKSQKEEPEIGVAGESSDFKQDRKIHSSEMVIR
jgi:hypothetical protein